MYISVRPADARDELILYEWWNDTSTRQMMKKNERVSLTEHSNWFNNFLKQNHSVMYIGEVSGGDRFGVVRFIYQSKNIFDVSINLSPKYRGKGLGTKLLGLCVSDYLVNFPEALLFAGYKKINYASKKCFLSNGFVVTSKEKLPQCAKLNNFDELSEELVVYKKS